ncbi:MAG: sulfide/dihydroorotate dehydrogenase-like FAD/NAD-binding protein [Candidatus Bathyarchaeota archaeon]|nr:MAG: sulfide/dihydroorotate dehydrogenase-like FAD/NAD-binding protein [Candidatus Bathyarchaeota archaeon]
MNKIVKKEILAQGIKLLEVEAPQISKKTQPGQFLVLRIDEKGERMPLTIFDADFTKGTVKIIFQEVGKTTVQLGQLKVGDHILNLMGPLGNPSNIKNYGHVIIIGGGVGIALAYPITKALKRAGNKITSILGARTEALLILEDKMRDLSDKLYVTTDDGSKGHHGFVTDILKELIEKEKIDLVHAVGPTVMMRAVARVTKPNRIKTIVSLNPIMLDGTGMCGGCRVTIGGKTKFCCVDGPEFDAHLVDFNQLMTRLSMYLDEEKVALQVLKKKGVNGV